MKRLAPLIVILALLAAIGFWWFSPIQVLKRRTENLLQTLTLKSGTGKSMRQMGVYSLSSILADDVELKSSSITEANGFFPRSEMESAYSWLCEQASQSRFELVKFKSVKSDGQTGDVTFLVKSLVELPERRLADGVYQVTFHWRHGDGGWLLDRAEWQEEKP
ncbi:MAG: hypothetical protein WCS43_06555 [Verrucomicrobiota bacterium]